MITDQDLSRRIDAIGSLLADCPDVDHRMALLGYALATTLLSGNAEERQKLMFNFGACVRIQLDAMDRVTGGVTTARMQ